MYVGVARPDTPRWGEEGPFFLLTTGNGTIAHCVDWGSGSQYPTGQCAYYAYLLIVVQ